MECEGWSVDCRVWSVGCLECGGRVWSQESGPFIVLKCQSCSYDMHLINQCIPPELPHSRLQVVEQLHLHRYRMSGKHPKKA